MSEEPPSPLRLKPRLRPATEAAPAEAVPPLPAPAEPAPAAPVAEESAAPKLRIKPKLMAEEPAATPAAAVESPAPPASTPESSTPEPAAAPSERLRLKPKLNQEPAATPAAEAPTPAAPPAAAEPETPAEAPADEAPKFKLKPKGTGAPSPASDPAPADAPAPPLVPGGSAPPLRPGAPKGIKILPPVVHIRAPEGMDEETVVPKPPPPPHATYKKKLLLAALLLGVLILGGGGFYAWVAYNEPAPLPPPQLKPVAAKPVVKVGPTPSETLNQIAAMPGAMINKAQDAIAIRRGAEQDRVESILEGKDPTSRKLLESPVSEPAGEKPAPAETGPTVTRAQSQLAPGITATTTDVIAGAEASAAFRSFVGGLKISGVFQGNPPRALINGRTYRTGELVDIPLGVAFDSADADKKIVTFKDRTGATVSRRY